MSIEDLPDTALALLAPGRGLLALDAATEGTGRQPAEAGVPGSDGNRRAKREVLPVAPGPGECLSGVVLDDEAIRDRTGDGTTYARILEGDGILPGIRVDRGAHPLAGFPGELVTEGLDGLRTRLQAYRVLGARFTLWRAIIRIGGNMPSGTCIDANCHALARYAALCQEQGLVPVLAPGVLAEGDHDIDTAFEVHEVVLRSLFDALYNASVAPDSVVLATTMVRPGSDCDEQAGPEEVAETTLACLKAAVPAIVPGIAFLPSGLGNGFAACLEAITRMGPHPWRLTFCDEIRNDTIPRPGAGDPAADAGVTRDACLARLRAMARATLVQAGGG